MSSEPAVRPTAPIRFGSTGSIVAVLVKIALLGIVDAIAVFAAFTLFMQQQWIVFGLVVVVTIFINIVYLRRDWLPAKYLLPGVIFLAVFQLFVVGYSGYIAFTNYGDGHNSTKEDAIAAIIQRSQERVPDSDAYGLTVLDQLGTISFLVTDPDGDAFIGGQDRPLEPARDAEFEGGKAVALPGYTTQTFADLLQRQREIADIAVPLSDDPNDGALRTPDGSSAYLYTSTLVYDEVADSFTDTRTGEVYVDNDHGSTSHGMSAPPSSTLLTKPKSWLSRPSHTSADRKPGNAYGSTMTTR